MENYKRIEPLQIPENDLPLIVLEEDRRSFLGFAIKSHSKGNYNHICEMHKVGMIVSQDPGGYKERSVEVYLKPQIFLKFWKYKPMTAERKKIWLSNIDKGIKQPWWKRRYDFLGILGQGLCIKWLQSPWAHYCSERVIDDISCPLNILIPKGSTPSDMNMYFNKDTRFEVYGYWFMD